MRSQLRQPVRPAATPAICLLAAALALAAQPAAAQLRLLQNPALVIDLATTATGSDELIRVSGPTGPTTSGRFGVPVAGGFDVDGDGHRDLAFAQIVASPRGRGLAGEVRLVFGDGTIGGALDAAANPTRLLVILGAGEREMAGSEIWMDDVTGDGLGDLIVCRQNFTGLGRVGAGAVTVVVGGPVLRNLAASSTVLDLAAPPAGVTLFTLVGAAPFDRLGVWARAGDVDGDGTADLVVAADQESRSGEPHHGALYVLRGGPHLARNAVADLARFGSSPYDGLWARVTPPGGSAEFHFGGTHQVGDLDGNGRAELIVAAALNRAGAGIGPTQAQAHGVGGPPGGRMWIVWDDAFPAGSWPAGYQVRLGAGAPGSVTVLRGGAQNRSFGEELLGGLDYDGDGQADLFVGDLVADGTNAQNRSVSGIGYVLYAAQRLKGRDLSIDQATSVVRVTKILGPVQGAIGADTATHGDLDGDGFDDLVVGNPHDSPQDRSGAGSMHVFFGRRTGWPPVIDTAPGRLPPSWRGAITEIQGRAGQGGPNDIGDTLCYSAAAGDLDRDGRIDIITNEMVGNGVAPGAVDVGNLIVLGGSMVSPPVTNGGAPPEGPGATGAGSNDSPVGPGRRGRVRREGRSPG